MGIVHRVPCIPDYDWGSEVVKARVKNEPAMSKHGAPLVWSILNISTELRSDENNI